MLTESEETSAPSLVEKLAQQAEAAGASDIHLQMVSGEAEVSFRLDGMMVPAARFPSEVAERIFGRIKFLARLKTYQESMPQDGRIDRRALHLQTDVRVATYPTVTGEKIVLRLFGAGGARSLSELAFPADAQAAMEKFLRQTSGLLLLTGPAGSGKTTTIYACLRALAALGGRHIITIEDPVEQIVPGVMQTEISEARGLDFAKAARHLLRQDPQALVIGEIRDEETANIAVRAALTGHLVISTLHAGSCKGVLERLQVMCPDHSATAAALELIVNQRLMRRLCAACHGAGCETCLRTGYRGRVPAVEWLAVDDALRGKIRARDLQAVRAARPLEQSARALLAQGVTNDAEYRRIFGL
ncbi:MAG TPA: ATPase, T2SS/T4P/T4SS family [Verrucomicrobiae bacterium]|jgi:type II secretory ATPase GspE/PulE/Tfp pilus assembly ATPase PilB-like protein|nr:ATPase, T2SS/T4P/T4SS family [Verrucomicrobiae bacterium]